MLLKNVPYGEEERYRFFKRAFIEEGKTGFAGSWIPERSSLLSFHLGSPLSKSLGKRRLD